MTMAAYPEAQNLAQFHELLKEFRMFRKESKFVPRPADVHNAREKHEAGWEEYEYRLNEFFKKLCSKPNVKSYIASGDNSFAYLSRDIIYDIFDHEINYQRALESLFDLSGIWGKKARKQLNKLDSKGTNRGNTVLGGESGRYHSFKNQWVDRRWENLVHEASTLYGSLKLTDLCVWSAEFGEQFYTSLKPWFRKIDITYHPSKLHQSKRMLQPLRQFLVKQLQSGTLRHLSLAYNADLGLEEELKQFCLSNRFDYLDWDCRTLSAEFFVQIYNAFRLLHVEPDCRSRQVYGLLEPAALNEFVQTLNLEETGVRSASWCKEEVSIVSADYFVEIIVDFAEYNTACAVAILMGHRESCKTVDQEEQQTEDDKDVEGDRMECQYDTAIALQNFDGIWDDDDNDDDDDDDDSDEDDEYEMESEDDEDEDSDNMEYQDDDVPLKTMKFVKNVAEESYKNEDDKELTPLECRNRGCTKQRCCCNCKCELVGLNKDNWTDGDCRYCEHCEFCHPCELQACYCEKCEKLGRCM